ncbi:hypothetical protein ACFPZ0_05315 [Streptomonospora nanhaiensis]|uniref:Uncharacterized protein n=1 Tax=Streptomonospora nanhaiensis TaxID=1323731 RepID=A0A853BHL0_9ACTN|nr:hypothetical protein [Streptomonospora nanhaiensis]MBV2365032.1 hypothetical protein [Streptomonospora nanhaiensis]MBX9388299.1 hypothetical protein [Streptomonospora nanhaiensis]NYI94510.1 hypothetical protein [Streptomonospora nanhaiensis]
MSDPLNVVEVELARAIVQAVVQGLADLVRKVPALFRRGGGEDAEQEAQAELDRSAAALEAASGADREREVVRQEATWETLLRRLPADDAGTRAAAEALLAELRAGLVQAPAQDGGGTQAVSGGEVGAVQQVRAGRDAFTAGGDQHFGSGPDARR